MPRPYASAVIPASVEQVWALARDFDGLPGWHPAIEASTLDSGTGAEVGAVRRLTLGDGGVVVERLLRLDDVDRVCTYEILESRSACAATSRPSRSPPSPTPGRRSASGGRSTTQRRPTRPSSPPSSRTGCSPAGWAACSSGSPEGDRRGAPRVPR